MQARIYKPAKTAMQSNDKNNQKWVLKFEPTGKFRDKIMDWVSSDETNNQVILYFDSAEDALNYAQKHNINYVITYPNVRKRKIKSYADNFNE